MLIFSVILMMVTQSEGTTSSLPSPPASAANNVGATSPDGMQIGVDTLSTVRSKLGKPTSITSTSDGMTVVVYVMSKSRVKGASFIPLVGMFAGGAKTNVSTKTFTFDQAGLLKSFASSDVTSDCQMTVVSMRCH